jgi:hypothetical protein
VVPGVASETQNIRVCQPTVEAYVPLAPSSESASESDRIARRPRFAGDFFGVGRVLDGEGFRGVPGAKIKRQASLTTQGPPIYQTYCGDLTHLKIHRLLLQMGHWNPSKVFVSSPPHLGDGIWYTYSLRLQNRHRCRLRDQCIRRFLPGSLIGEKHE